MSEQTKYILDETHIPKSWYNLIADLPKRYVGWSSCFRRETTMFLPPSLYSMMRNV